MAHVQTDLEDDPHRVAVNHEWWVVPLAGDLSPGSAPTELTYRDELDRLVTGWRARCDCGWRGLTQLRSFGARDLDTAAKRHRYSTSGWPTPYVLGYVDAAATAHVDQVLEHAYGVPYVNGTPVPA